MAEFRRQTPSPSPAQLEAGEYRTPISRGSEAPELERWFKDFEELNALLERMKISTANIDRLHRQALLNGRSDEVQMDALIKGFAQSATRCRQLLDSMATGLEDSTQRKTSLDNARQRFVKVMSEYEKVLREQREKYRQHLQRQYLIINPHASTSDLNRLEAATGYGQLSGDPHVLTATLFATALKQDAQQGLVLMEERLSDMQRLEASVREVAQLWNDLALLVSAQGERVRKLRHHVSQVEEYTGKTVVETKSAVNKVMSRRKLKIIVFSILAVLAVIIVIYLIIELKG